MTETTNPKFAHWAIVEVMGHHTYAGFVTEQTLAGQAFVRVDVPEVEGLAAFSKLLGAGSIYAITPVTEEIARWKAARVQQQPVHVYDLPEALQEALRAARRPGLPSAQADDDEPSDQDDGPSDQIVLHL